MKAARQKTLNDPVKCAAQKAKVSRVLKGRKLSDGHRLKISLATKERYKSPEEHKKTSECKIGERNAQWRGGISSGKYCHKFNEYLRESIRDEFGRKCVICGIAENGQRLDVHHVNFDKAAGCYGKRWNLVPLCRSCHAWTTSHRWQAFVC